MSNTKVLEGINGQPSTACNIKDKDRKHMILLCSAFIKDNNQQHSMQLSDISYCKFFYVQYTVFTNGGHAGKNWCLVMKARRWRINKNCK